MRYCCAECRGGVTPYEVREMVKRLVDRRTPEGYELVMLMHYERSRESWAACKRAADHPPWEEFARAYIAGDIARREVDAAVWLELMTRYPPKPSAHLPPGASYWGQSSGAHSWDTAMAATAALGWNAEGVVEGDVVASLLRRLAEALPAGGVWKGTASELYVVLAGLASDQQRRAHSWPVDAARLSGRIQRVAPAVGMLGITVTRTREGRPGTRCFTISRTPREHT